MYLIKSYLVKVEEKGREEENKAQKIILLYRSKTLSTSTLWPF